MIYISHDLLSVLQLCQNIAVLHAGRVVESLLTAQIGEQAQHPATLALLRSLPVPAGVLWNYSRQKQAVTSVQSM